MAQIPRAGNGYTPLLFKVQDLRKLVNQITDMIARTLLAELAKMRQILANLRRAYAQTAPEITRRSRQFAITHGHAIQLTQIDWQPAYDNFWDLSGHVIKFLSATFHNSNIVKLLRQTS